eukprot:Selendium_serpulae@DN10041_c0_g1_i1.p3
MDSRRGWLHYSTKLRLIALTAGVIDYGPHKKQHDTLLASPSLPPPTASPLRPPTVCSSPIRQTSINRSINRSINQSINRSIDPSINQSIDQSIHQSINQSINRSINQ